MSKKIELKPCPFCGGEAEHKTEVQVNPVIDSNGAYVDADTFYFEATGCQNCDVWILSQDDEPEGVTIEKWNRRAINEQLNQQTGCDYNTSYAKRT